MSVLSPASSLSVRIPIAPPVLPARIAGARRAAIMRRRRLAVTLLVAALVVWPLAVVLAGALHPATAAAPPAQPARIGVDGAVVQPATALREYTVAPGDTLWRMATQLSGDSDPRPMVDRIVQLNGLASQQLVAGSVLLLPTHAEAA